MKGSEVNGKRDEAEESVVLGRNQRNVYPGKEHSPLFHDSIAGEHDYSLEYISRSGLNRYNSALKNLIPMRSTNVKEGSTPSDNAGLFSYVFTTWLTRYLWKAYKSGITFEDLPPISPYDTTYYNTQRLESLWQKELYTHGPRGVSFQTVAWKFVRTRVFVGCFLLTCSIVFGFISPAILMKRVLEHIESPSGTVWDGAKWVILLTACDCLRSTFFAWTWVTNYRTALRLKVACTALLYRKILQLHSLGNKSTGELINLISNDSQRLFDTVTYGPMVISGPIATTLGVIYILWLFNPVALLGMAVFLLFYPCQYLISRATGYFRSKTVKITDSRVRLMTEILESIRLIKTYAWEKYFSKNLLDIRKREETWLRRTAYFQSLSLSLTPAVPVISSIVTFLAYTSTGNSLTAAQAFPISTIFWTVIRLALVGIKEFTRHFAAALVAFRRYKVFPLVTLFTSQIRSFFMFLQVGLVSIAESDVTLDRLKNVLLMDEIKCHIARPIVKSEAVAIVGGTFAYEDTASKGSPEGPAKEHVEEAAERSRGPEEQKRGEKPTDAELERLNCGGEREEAKEAEEAKKALTSIDFEAWKGSLIGICGPVGSGKSSLLLAALGQLRMTGGRMSREGTCAYVGQQAWLMNASLRENVLFGERWEASRYYRALAVCGLSEDLDSLPAGDETEIGERGVNLSGGQKQRVALARAFYANRDIYYLDDPLSAVDAHVGAHIFENLIRQALRDKTVLFVTHQVQFLKYCDRVYAMHNGKIVEHGTHGELMELKKEYAAMVNSAQLSDAPGSEEQDGLGLAGGRGGKRSSTNGLAGGAAKASGPANDQERVREGETTRSEEERRPGSGGGGSLMAKDKVETGTVKSHTYLTYVAAAGGYLVAVLVFLAFFLNVGSFAFSQWWLATWINAGGGNVTVPRSNESNESNETNETTVHSNNLNDNPDYSYYQAVYGGCIGLIIVTSFARGLVTTYATVKASTSLHNRVFTKMIASPLTFFETTPIGRIQNIFSRDVDEVDNYLPITLEHVLQNIFTCSFSVLFVCSVLPWFCIPLIFLGAMFVFVSRIFRAAIRDLKRMESLTRSPVYSFVTTTIHGLNTIRAFNKEKEFLRKFEQLLDSNSSCFYLCQAAMRWSAIRLDGFAVVSTCIAGFLVVILKSEIPPALAGLALAYCAQMMGVFQFTVRVLVETEARFISVERINYYLRSLEEEEEAGERRPPSVRSVRSARLRKSRKSMTPPDDWPASGKIEFKKVGLRYRPELPLVLVDVSFVVAAGEKIGIVGRTGSGKSSLVVALFRLVEVATGLIRIDSVDVSGVSLASLRSRLSIIPQDPVLFSGTIRSNLDPFGQHSDSGIWEALEKTRLKERVKSMTGQLDAVVGFGGSNLSVGERQLLCLTRALLRHSKILILDEATAAVDPETEAMVQETIQKVFAPCTVLTIAHRLKTVLPCDRVFVMSEGRVVESGVPAALLSDPDTHFSKMLALLDK